jgi:hypothetical protein
MQSTTSTVSTIYNTLKNSRYMQRYGGKAGQHTLAGGFAEANPCNDFACLEPAAAHRFETDKSRD